MKFSNQKLESLAIGALLDAEGSVVRSNSVALLDASGLTASDFTSKRLASCLSVISTLNERNRPVSAKTVWGVGRGSGLLLETDLTVLEALQGQNEATREAFITHAEELKRLTLLRRLEAFHQKQLEELSSTRPDPSVLSSQMETFAANFVSSVTEDETGTNDVVGIIDDWCASDAGASPTVVQTGIEIIDEHLGGFVPNLNVIGGLPSVGKSALVAEIILSCLQRKLTVGLFGLEDGTAWVARRHIARGLNIPVGMVGRTRLPEYQQENLARHAEHLGSVMSDLLVYRRAGIDPDALLAKAKHWILNKGCKLIIIDHGGEVRHQNPDAKDRHDLAVANTYRQLRDLAVNTRVPIVVLCHFNRGTEQTGKPSPKSFAETAYIERMARVAIGLWESDKDPEYLRCTVLKCTEGKHGYTLLIRRDAEHALVHRMGGLVLDESVEHEAKQQKASKSWSR